MVDASGIDVFIGALDLCCYAGRARLLGFGVSRIWPGWLSLPFPSFRQSLPVRLIKPEWPRWVNVEIPTPLLRLDQAPPEDVRRSTVRDTLWMPAGEPSLHKWRRCAAICQWSHRSFPKVVRHTQPRLRTHRRLAAAH